MRRMHFAISTIVFSVLLIGGLFLLNKRQSPLLEIINGSSLTDANQKAQLSENTEGDFITSDGIRIHYWYFNRGTDVVTIFLHGGPGGSTSDIRQFGQAERYADKFGSLLAFDQRGGGESERDATVLGESVTIDRFIQDINELREKVIPDHKVVVFGRSFGGLLGVRYAASHPEGVLGYLLVVPGQFSSDNVLLEKQRADLVTSVGGQEEMNRISQQEKDIALNIRKQQGSPDTAQLDNTNHDNDISVGDALRANSDYYQHEEYSLLPNLTNIPTVVVYGAYDMEVPPLAIEAMKPYLPDATFVELPGGHGSAYTYEKEFFEGVQKLFDQVKDNQNTERF